MGVITNYIKLTKNNETRKIFTYSSGKGTVNRIIISDANKYVAQLLNDGWHIC